MGSCFTEKESLKQLAFCVIVAVFIKETNTCTSFNMFFLMPNLISNSILQKIKFTPSKSLTPQEKNNYYLIIILLLLYLNPMNNPVLH